MIGFGAHPAGLSTLFFTELWERFSFYGLQAILILYMVAPLDAGGLAYSVASAAVVFGNYTMSVYLLSAVGGYVADRWLGAPLAVFIGAVIITAGHACLAFGGGGSLYVGLSLVAVGTALLKPNVTGLVGGLYSADDPRRDAGFSLYYMGINIGAFVSPLLCGYLAQGEAFRQWLAASGFDPRHSWHWGFGAAGVGMLVGLLAFARLWRRLHGAHAQRQRPALPVDSTLQASYARRFAAIGFFCVCAVLFFAMSKQAGSSLNLFADQNTRTEMFGWAFPSSWFQSVSALWVIVLAPIFSTLWLRLGDRQPSSPAKVVMGLAAASTSFVIMTFAAQAAGQGSVSPLWLLAVYFVQTIGEMCVSPVGLSNVTRLAPPRLVGFVLGLWFVAIAFGAKLAGLAAAWMGSSAQEAVSKIFAQQAVLVAVFCALLALTIPRVRRLIQTLEASR